MLKIEQDGLVSAPLVRARFATTRFLDGEEEQRARQGLEQAAG